MAKKLFSRIQARLRGLVREANMYLGDFTRSLHWMLGAKKHYQENFEEIAGKHKWVFIIGCNNSGTSIVQRIMNQTGSVSTMKLEGQRYTKVFPRAMRSGKERVWMEYEDDLLIDSDNTKASAPRLLFDWLSNTPKPLHKYILEKTPANLLRMEWLDQSIPNCYFIGLVRDGYAVSEGIRRKSHKSIERAAIQWNRANQALEKNKVKVKNYMELRYEDMVDDPKDAFVRISKFVGAQSLEIESAMNIDYGLKTVSGEKITGLKNLNQKSMDRLSDEDIKIINHYAGNMLKSHGYFKSEKDQVTQ